MAAELEAEERRKYKVLDSWQFNYMQQTDTKHRFNATGIMRTLAVSMLQ